MVYQWIEILHFWIWKKLANVGNLQVFHTVYPAQDHTLSSYCKVDNFQNIYTSRDRTNIYQKARNPMDVLFLFSLAIPYDTDIYWQHAYVDRASTTLAVCLPPSSYRPCAAMPKWLHQRPKLFLACVPGIQSLLNGSSAFANQILLRIDPLLRPLLQFLDGFHTIQFSRRSIILQWRVFGTKNFVQ